MLAPTKLKPMNSITNVAKTLLLNLLATETVKSILLAQIAYIHTT
jgi:CRISPR/Cas system-associated endonuclease Cas1